jgi:hypothetical protein
MAQFGKMQWEQRFNVIIGTKDDDNLTQKKGAFLTREKRLFPYLR